MQQCAGQLQRGLSAYTWSKQALLSLGEGLCGELTGSGISVHVICPGVVITEMAIGLATALGGQRREPSSGAVSDAVMAEAMLRQRLAALSADEAAEYILQGLVTNKVCTAVNAYIYARMCACVRCFWGLGDDVW